MRKRITILVAALMLALTMSFGVTGAFAAKTTTFEKGVCMTKAGQGGGSGSIKEQHHGNCNSNGADFQGQELREGLFSSRLLSRGR